MKITTPLFSLLLLVAVAGCKEKPKEPNTGPYTLRPDSMIVPNTGAMNTYASVDLSPMDMSYFPVDYTKLKMAGNVVDPPVARVIYSRPHLAKRHLFHDLLKYEEPWRLGANEATEIDFYKPVTIQDKKVLPGRYIIYCIPHSDTWTIVLNSNIDSWGLRQDPSKDIQRFTIPITSGNPLQEYFTMVFEKTDKGANLLMAWDNVLAKLPIEF